MRVSWVLGRYSGRIDVESSLTEISIYGRDAE